MTNTRSHNTVTNHFTHIEIHHTIANNEWICNETNKRQLPYRFTQYNPHDDHFPTRSNLTHEMKNKLLCEYQIPINLSVTPIIPIILGINNLCLKSCIGY